MKLRVWKALARGVVLESLRRKDLWVVAILGFLIMVSAGAIGFFGFQGLEVFAKDLAVNVLGLFSTIVAVLTSSRMLPDEIRNRTLYPLLARPITRLDLLIGKLLGAVAVTWVAFLILAALTGVALLIFNVRFEPIMLQYLLLKMMGLALLCTVGVMFSAYLTPAAAATLTFVLAFGSSTIVNALVMAYPSVDPVSQVVFKLVTAMLPQFDLFDIGSRVANIGWAPAPAWVVGALAGYLLVYGAAMMVLSWLKFRKQAV